MREGVFGEVASVGLVLDRFVDEVAVAFGVGQEISEGSVAVVGVTPVVEPGDDALLDGEVVGDPLA